MHRWCGCRSRTNGNGTWVAVGAQVEESGALSWASTNDGGTWTPAGTIPATAAPNAVSYARLDA